MTAVWWGKESGESRSARLKRVGDAQAPQPELLRSSRESVVDELRSRTRGFAPEWTSLNAADAGVALTRLFGEQMEPVLERLNRLPEKALIEFLNMAGVEPLPPSPAAALVEFQVSEDAAQSVLVSTGFQIGARPADGSSELVIFETERDLLAAPSRIVEMHVQTDNLFQPIDSQAESFLPFGNRPAPGAAMLIGLEGNITPGPTISIGIRVASPPGAPPPISAGGVAPLPTPAGPLLEWSVLDGARFEPAEIALDETGGLIHSGIVELRLPEQWRVGRPAGLEGANMLRWLRLQIVFGTFQESPVLASVKLNMVRVAATRTILNEALEREPRSGNRRMRLSQKPVLAESLILEIDEGGFISGSEPEVNAPIVAGQISDASANGGADAPKGTKTRRWRQVDDVALYGPDDEVYMLDALEGVVTFGDGVHGAAAPQGFRNVRAVRYRAGGGKAGAVTAGALNTPLSSVPFITKAVNPWPAFGGSDRETQQQAIRRGPQEIRSRGRAVAVADYAVLSRRAPGALVQRAQAVAGLHPAFPGRAIPGVVGIYIVPPDRGEGPPTPDEDTLRAVAEYLSKSAAPAGVEVVAASPRYHKVKIEAAITVRPGADSGETVRRALRTLDAYLHPLTGGEDGAGWPFGGRLRYQALLRRLTNVDGVSAVPMLNIIADGFRFPACEDFAPDAHALLWPDLHRIVVQQQEEGR